MPTVVGELTDRGVRDRAVTDDVDGRRPPGRRDLGARLGPAARPGAPRQRRGDGVRCSSWPASAASGRSCWPPPTPSSAPYDGTITEDVAAAPADAVRLDQGRRGDAAVRLRRRLRPAHARAPADQRLRTRHEGQGLLRAAAAQGRGARRGRRGLRRRPAAPRPRARPRRGPRLRAGRRGLLTGLAQRADHHRQRFLGHGARPRWPRPARPPARPIPAEHVPAKDGEMPAVVVDTARARSLGWEPSVSLVEGMAGTWADLSPAPSLDLS